MATQQAGVPFVVGDRSSIGPSGWRHYATGLAIGLLAAAIPAAAQEPVISVEPDTFEGTRSAVQPVDKEAAARPPTAPQRVFTLAAPTVAEIRQAESRDGGPRVAPRQPERSRTPTSSVFDPDGGRTAVPQVHRVGIGREFGQLGTREVPGIGGFDWQRQADGGLALALGVVSTGAKALRAELRLQRLPSGLQVRVYAPAAPAATLVAVPSHQIAPGRNGAVSVWTPTVAGDALAVELYLPPGTSPAGLRVSIPRVSHLAVEPFRASDIGSAWCDVPDAACAADQISAAARAAVAKYLYTSARGATSYCTGTLLNDADRGSQVPYFLTARHCIRSQQQATSMEFYWFFERVECGSDDVSATRQTGGATVLAQDALNGPGTGTDHILLRLNSDPPARVGMAGWSTAPPTPGDGVGVHHPGGDLKKVTSGAVGSFHRWQSRGRLATSPPTRPAATWSTARRRARRAAAAVPGCGSGSTAPTTWSGC